MRLISFFVIVSILISFLPSTVLGCECVQVSPPDTRKWLRESKGPIFTGEVVKIEEIHIPAQDHGEYFYLKRQVTFKVIKIWKNADSEELVVRTGSGGGDCGFRFVEGEKYLVDAYSFKGNLETGICTFTRKLSDAKKLIKELDRIVAAPKNRT